MHQEARRLELQKRLIKIEDLESTAQGRFSITTPGSGKRQVVLDEAMSAEVGSILAEMKDDIKSELAAIDEENNIETITIPSGDDNAIAND